MRWPGGTTGAADDLVAVVDVECSATEATERAEVAGDIPAVPVRLPPEGMPGPADESSVPDDVALIVDTAETAAERPRREPEIERDVRPRAVLTPDERVQRAAVEAVAGDQAGRVDRAGITVRHPRQHGQGAHPAVLPDERKAVERIGGRVDEVRGKVIRPADHLPAGINGPGVAVDRPRHAPDGAHGPAAPKERLVLLTAIDRIRVGIVCRADDASAVIDPQPDGDEPAEGAEIRRLPVIPAESEGKFIGRGGKTGDLSGLVDAERVALGAAEGAEIGDGVRRRNAAVLQPFDVQLHVAAPEKNAFFPPVSNDPFGRTAGQETEKKTGLAEIGGPRWFRDEKCLTRRGKCPIRPRRE